MIVALAFTAALLAQPSDILLHLPLDGQTQPATGTCQVRVVGHARYAEGRVGQGLVVGDDACWLEVPVASTINLPAGTVAMWVKPIDWQPDDGKFHVFFEAKSPGWLLLYKYCDPPPRLLLLMSDNVRLHRWQYVAGDMSNWRPGQWHHIAATWDRTAARVFIDGKPLASLASPPLPVIETQTLFLGDRPWHIERNAKSVIDEVYIFSRPLHEEEVRALYEAGNQGRRPAAPLAAISAITLRAQPDGWQRKCQLLADIGGLPPAQRARAQVQARLITPDGKTSWQGNLPLVEAHLAAGSCPLALKPPGLWRAKAAVIVNGTPRGEAEAAMEIPDTSWMGYDEYEELKVLPPWTALRAQKTTVTVWSRTYNLSPLGLTQVTALGMDLLAGPCRIDATLDGHKLSVSSGQLRLLRATDAAAVYDARAQAPPLRLRSRLSAQFDGMIWFDLRLSADHPTTIDRLRLIIPMRADCARLYHVCGGSWTNSSAGALPDKPGVLYETDRLVPMVWLGDEEKGLLWFAETDRGWSVADGKPTVYVRRLGDVVEMVIEPISKPLRLSGPWRWAYGMMATPVKPLPPDWRKWRLEPGVGANVRIVWPVPKTIKYFGYPWPTDPDAFRAMVEEKHRQGVKVVPYSCLTFLSEASPEWRLFGKRWWVPGRADRQSSDVAAYNCAFMNVCPAAEGWADFAVWANKRYMQQFNLDGLYHDNTFPYACDNELHGCGWTGPDGVRHRTYPVLAHRRLYRRVYAMMKSLGRETYMIAHMSARVTMPVLSFVDAYLDGEQFRPHAVDDYRKVLTLGSLRAEFMGRQWGIMPVFLPELEAQARKGRAATRQMLSMTMLHDIPVWAIWCNSRVVDDLRRPLDEFGYVRARFVGYWEEPVQTGDDQVKASVYVRDGKALVIVTNLAYEAKTVQLKVQRSSLSLPPRLRATDAESGKSMAGAGQPIRVQVPAGDLRLIRLEKAP